MTPTSALLIGSLAATLTASDELVRNGGFEAGGQADATDWVCNNWAGNDASYAIVTSGAGSGARSMQMLMNRADKADNIQLYQFMPSLRPGDQIELSVLIRGPDNGRPLEAVFVRQAPPWNDWVRVPIRYSDAWQRQRTIIRLPDNLDPATVALNFMLHQEGAPIQLDAVSVRRLPERSDAPPMTGNLLANGSFEVGREQWTSSLPWWPTGGSVQPQLCGAFDAWDLETPVIDDAADGRRALRFTLAPTGTGIPSATVSSPWFAARFGQPLTVSFALRGPAGGTVEAALKHGKAGAEASVGKSFTSTGGSSWQRCTLPATLSASASGTYFLRFDTWTPGTWWIDDIRVAEAGDAGAAPLAVAVLATARTPVGDLHRPGAVTPYRIELQGPPASVVALVARVVDIDGAEQLRRELKPTLDAHGHGEVLLDGLPDRRYGPLRIELYRQGADPAEIPLAERVYQILPPIAPLGSATAANSPFGGHATTLGDRELAVAAAVGIRSLRLHRPEITKWCFTEPQDGRWDLDLPAKRLGEVHAQGFHILGSLGYTPDWAADAPAGAHRSWLQLAAWPPKQWERWRTYVQKVSAACAGSITDWELLNEPDLDEFMSVPAGYPDRVALYRRYIEETRAALALGNPKARLIGITPAQPLGGFVTDAIAAGLATDLDGIGFHYYGTAPLNLRERVAAWRGVPSRATGTVWMTEGAATVPAQTWLRSARLPTAVPEAMGAMCAQTVQSVIGMLAQGVGRYYQYPGPRSGNGGQRVNDPDWKFGDDVFANPLPLWSAWAAMVHQLEGATPAVSDALSEVTAEGVRVTRCRFIRGGTPITVLWADRDIPLAAVPGFDRAAKAWDLFANPLAMPHRLGARPVYLVGNR